MNNDTSDLATTFFSTLKNNGIEDGLIHQLQYDLCNSDNEKTVKATMELKEILGKSELSFGGKLAAMLTLLELYLHCIIEASRVERQKANANLN